MTIHYATEEEVKETAERMFAPLLDEIRQSQESLTKTVNTIYEELHIVHKLATNKASARDIERISDELHKVIGFNASNISRCDDEISKIRTQVVKNRRDLAARVRKIEGASNAK